MGQLLQAGIEMEIEQHEVAWLAALKDQNSRRLAILLHDEFTSTSARSSGEVLRKPEYLSAALQMRICDYELWNVKIYPIDDLAVVKARLICHSEFWNRSIHDDLLITDVWLRTTDGWKAVTRHSSNHISANRSEAGE